MERTTWIDATSRHIVRCEERQGFTGPPPVVLEHLTVDFLVVEIDGPIPADALHLRPPFYLEYQAAIQRIQLVLLYFTFLGIPSSLMVWLGHRHGLRAAPPVSIAVWAFLLSLILSWSIVAGPAGHGIFVLPVPAWFWLGVRVLRGPTDTGLTVFPQEWQPPIATLCAYIVGVLAGRAKTLRSLTRLVP